MKHIKLSLLLLLLFTNYFIAFQAKAAGGQCTTQQDSLSVYTGKYQTRQGMQTVFADVYIEKGKLTARSSTGDVLILDHVGGDNFSINNQNVPVKFIRDKDNRVYQISVNGSVSWTRVDYQSSVPSADKRLFNPNDFPGKYQTTVNGQILIIEVTLKNGQLWATQMWDGGSSALNFVSADKFIVNALSMPISFIRNKDNAITQFLLNNHDVFKKVKN